MLVKREVEYVPATKAFGNGESLRQQLPSERHCKYRALQYPNTSV
ncbi:hypothetical protein [Thermoanaerobacterium thermosaccharolyticum]